LQGDVERYNSADEDNFSQVKDFWGRVLNVEERKRLASNIGGHLKNASPAIRERAVKNFGQVHEEFGTLIRAAMA
jgi:catalase